ncbi:MAG: N-methylhydantoinase [Solirubrobacteraceae bacterium]|jgi:N-methylhydantoinase B|nr:N-methylhydantoinase [Solirubrobacteraceae bacterium]
MSVTSEPTAHIKTDPVTLEVFSNRIQNLMKLMTSTLENLAGTLVGRESGDYSTALLDRDGNTIAFGSMVGFHLGHMTSVVPWIYENLGRDSLRPGDMFLSNDPYSGGAVHSNDVGVFAPIFVDDELVGWTGCDMHCMDVGGALPGSFVPNAIDVVAEACRFSPVRIYGGGEYRPDVVRSFLSNTRLPERVGQDISAEVGANHYALKIVEETVREFGVERYLQLVEDVKAFSEARTRQRIEEELVDGVYEYVDYEEHDFVSHALYPIRVRLTVSGSELFLDFTGTAAQAPSLINCSRSGLKGAVMAALLMQLVPDIPFNAGVMRPVHVLSEGGTINDCNAPAPVSLATAMAAWRTVDVVSGVLTRAVDASPSEFLRDRATACWGGTWPVYVLSSTSDQYGNYSVFLNMDGSGEGSGALRGLDGARGSSILLAGRVPSVEAHELTEPNLYIARRIWADSAGAGRWRGGWSFQEVVTPWGEKTADQSGTFCTSRNAVPTPGAFGGYPGSGVFYGVIEDADIAGRIADGRLPSWDDLDVDANIEILEAKEVWEGRRQLRKGNDAFVMTFAAGGGFGDPLERDPDRVRADVEEGIVSIEAARGVYGVELTAGADGTFEADLERVEKDRDALRAERLRGVG